MYRLRLCALMRMSLKLWVIFSPASRVMISVFPYVRLYNRLIIDAVVWHNLCARASFCLPPAWFCNEARFNPDRNQIVIFMENGLQIRHRCEFFDSILKDICRLAA